MSLTNLVSKIREEAKSYDSNKLGSCVKEYGVALLPGMLGYSIYCSDQTKPSSTRIKKAISAEVVRLLVYPLPVPFTWWVATGFFLASAKPKTAETDKLPGELIPAQSSNNISKDSVNGCALYEIYSKQPNN